MSNNLRPTKNSIVSCFLPLFQCRSLPLGFLFSLMLKRLLCVSFPENAFAEMKSDSNLSPPSENFNLTAEEAEEPPIEQTVTTSQSKPSRTPLHLLQYLSDLETPSPNSRQVTPMPKTTLFISPPGSTETAAIDSSLSLASPENVVNRFPAQKDIVPLVSLTPGCHALTTTPGKLPVFHLDDSPANGEKRRDSVFFAPTHSSEVRVQDNLMLFSPIQEVNEGLCRNVSS